MRAAIDLVETHGGKINGIACLVELTFLKGREKIEGYDLYTLLKFDNEKVEKK